MDTVPFSDREKQTLKRFGFPSHSIYSRGVAEKDDVKRMGFPFYRYRVFKTPNEYVLTRRKYSSEREKPMGEEKRVGKDTSLESLLRTASISESNSIKLTEDKLRQLIREEANSLVNEKGRFYDQHGYETYKKNLEGTVVDGAEVGMGRLSFFTPGASYDVYGDDIKVNGKEPDGLTPFSTSKKVKSVSKRRAAGKFGSAESLFIEVGGMTFKVKEPRDFTYSMDRR